MDREMLRLALEFISSNVATVFSWPVAAVAIVLILRGRLLDLLGRTMDKGGETTVEVLGVKLVIRAQREFVEEQESVEELPVIEARVVEPPEVDYFPVVQESARRGWEWSRFWNFIYVKSNLDKAGLASLDILSKFEEPIARESAFPWNFDPAHLDSHRRALESLQELTLIEVIDEKLLVTEYGRDFLRFLADPRSPTDKENTAD